MVLSENVAILPNIVHTYLQIKSTSKLEFYTMTQYYQVVYLYSCRYVGTLERSNIPNNPILTEHSKLKLSLERERERVSYGPKMKG